VRRRRPRVRLRLDGERDPASSVRVDPRLFASARDDEAGGRSRTAALAACALLAVAIHGCVLFGALWWLGALAPARETFVRVVLFPSAGESPAEAPPAAPPVAPRAETRERSRPPRPRAIETPPAAESAPVAPDTAAVRSPSEGAASDPAPVALATIAARPRYKINPEPPYPALARRRRQEGVVLLSVRVDSAGRPEAVAIQTSSGYRALDEAALEAVRRWEFEPGRVGGEPVPSQVEVPIHFRLGDD
jgi:protein TonB